MTVAEQAQKRGAELRRGLGQVCDPAAGVGGLHDQMEILGFDDRFPAVHFRLSGGRSLTRYTGRLSRPSHVQTSMSSDPFELDPTPDEPVEQSLVDVDRAGIDEVLVAGVDLRPDADLAQAQKDDRNIG